MAESNRKHETRDRAESFGEWAQEYDDHRPTYPAAMVDHLVADEPGSVLDVGCGTGKLGQRFVERGLPVHGVEPDARMAAVAERNGLTVDVSRFEPWEPDGRTFDLITAGTSWHWVEPVAGCAKAFDVLNPGGMIALAWHFPSRYEGINESVDAAYAKFAPEHDDEGDDDDMAASFAPLLAPPWSDAANHWFAWSHTYSTDDWLAYLDTTSTHRVLDPDRRAALYGGIRSAIDAEGGSLTIDYTTLVLSAIRPA